MLFSVQTPPWGDDNPAGLTMLSVPTMKYLMNGYSVVAILLNTFLVQKS